MDGFRQEQRSNLLPALVAGVVIVVFVVAAVATGDGVLIAVMVPVVLLAGLIGLVLSRLVVTVDDTAVRWRFGLGLFRNAVPLGDIAAARTSEKSWAYGLGLRWTPRGWLYRVRGTETVEVELRSGGRVFLGSDDPAALVGAILRRLPGRAEHRGAR